MADFKIINDKKTTKIGKMELISKALVAVVCSNPKYKRVLKHTMEKKANTRMYITFALHSFTIVLK
jgi:hypothetical protein